jgi:diguanylate cyclase (GGDEF)-like protein
MLDRLEQAMASSARHLQHGALMLIDLDNFKAINDSFGHDVGDQILIAVASRLESCIREGDTVARLGGDEFVVILEDLDKTGIAAMQAENVARKILSELGRPYLLDLALTGGELNRRSHRCSSSIGITLFRDLPESVDELMKRADTAMYQAKAAGRNTLRFFDPEMQATVSARAAMEVDLRKAILEEQFVFHYQAQVDASECVIGAEVLLRWQRPEGNLVFPGDFIPLSEDTGLMLPLGQWIMETACMQLADWATQPGMTHLSLAVNVGFRQFHHADFVDQVLAMLDRSGANPRRLKLELTEILLAENVESAIVKMAALTQRGVCFSLDDFGTGYSSLALLHRLPLEQLKIDQSFVQGVLTDQNHAAITSTIVSLGRSLGLAVIAEGVETEGQRDFLKALGCLSYQGYLYSHPLPLDAFEAFVKEV